MIATFLLPSPHRRSTNNGHKRKGEWTGEDGSGLPAETSTQFASTKQFVCLRARADFMSFFEEGGKKGSWLIAARNNNRSASYSSFRRCSSSLEKEFLGKSETKKKKKRGANAEKGERRRGP